MSVAVSKSRDICIALTSALVVAVSVVLLTCRFLTGSDFVFLSIGNGIITMVIWHMPKIAEFSIAGYTVKLKNTLDDATSLTADLRSLRRVMMKQFLNSIKINNGNSHQIVRGFFNFASVYNEIVHQKDLMNEFNNDILQITEKLLGYCAEFFNSVGGKNFTVLSLDEIRRNLDSIVTIRNRYFSNMVEAENPSLGGINVAHFSELIIILYHLYESIKIRHYTPIQLPEFDEQTYYCQSEPFHRPSPKYRWKSSAQ